MKRRTYWLYPQRCEVNRARAAADKQGKDGGGRLWMRGREETENDDARDEQSADPAARLLGICIDCVYIWNKREEEG